MLSIVLNDKICALAQFVSWHLGRHALLHLLANSPIAAHNALDSHLIGGGYGHHRINHLVEMALEKDSRFEKNKSDRLRRSPLNKIDGNNGMYQSVELLQQIRIGKHALRYVGLVVAALGSIGLRTQQSDNTLAQL